MELLVTDVEVVVVIVVRVIDTVVPSRDNGTQ
jgi:hypothetical protein